MDLEFIIKSKNNKNYYFVNISSFICFDELPCLYLGNKIEKIKKKFPKMEDLFCFINKQKKMKNNQISFDNLNSVKNINLLY